MSDNPQTPPPTPVFNFDAYPPDTCFYDRREGRDRRAESEPAPQPAAPAPERRAKTERRKRVDPTTFERQYSDEELDFMNAMQAFKQRTGKSFPSYAEVLAVARAQGYLKTGPTNEINHAFGNG